MVFKDTNWDLMRWKHFEVFLYCWPVVANLPASETFQPIRGQDRGSAPITIQAGEVGGARWLCFTLRMLFLLRISDINLSLLQLKPIQGSTS